MALRVWWCCPEMPRVVSVLEQLLGSVRQEPGAAARVCEAVGVTGCAHEYAEGDCCPGVMLMMRSTGVPGKAAWASRLPRTEMNIHKPTVLASSRGAQLWIPQKHGFHNSNVYLALISSGQVPRLWLHPPPLPVAGCCPCWLLPCSLEEPDQKCSDYCSAFPTFTLGQVWSSSDLLQGWMEICSLTGSFHIVWSLVRELRFFFKCFVVISLVATCICNLSSFSHSSPVRRIWPCCVCTYSAGSWRQEWDPIICLPSFGLHKWGTFLAFHFSCLSRPLEVATLSSSLSILLPSFTPSANLLGSGIIFVSSPSIIPEVQPDPDRVIQFHIFCCLGKLI